MKVLNKTGQNHKEEYNLNIYANTSIWYNICVQIDNFIKYTYL